MTTSTKRTTKKQQKIMYWLFLGLCCLFIFVSAACVIKLKDETNKLAKQVEVLEKELAECQKVETLELKCGPEKIVMGLTNGIKRVGLKNFECLTTYPIVLWQAIGKDGEVLAASTYQNKGTAQRTDFHLDLFDERLITDDMSEQESEKAKKDNLRALERLSDKITSIKLVGCDKSGNVIESKVCDIQILD